MRFSELVPAASAEGGSAGPAETTGVNLNSSSRVFTQGDLRETGSPLDVAISGDGFIELIGPGGENLLWRGGQLKINADGQLAAANGLALKAGITVPEGATALTIARDGTVTAIAEGETTASEIGKIELAQVRDVGAVTALEGGLYRVTSPEDLVTADMESTSGGAFVQGSLEASNVELTEEMVSLLLMQRAYAANAQVVQAGDQLMAIANGLKR
ncbi:MAG: flagellar hook-basal body protein [Alphaproteobacteria bacterium]|nr:MAG: flagellar hook-basal body protein [Alphaproteobacteria bacterium]